MNKTILLTGATDGIGLETAKMLLSQNHTVLLHGRSGEKLERVEKELHALYPNAVTETYVADLSRAVDAHQLADAVAESHTRLDAIINNAGVYNAANPITDTGVDIRFAVNTIAPYILTSRLLPLLDKDSRVVNVSSAAQAPVNLDALEGRVALGAGAAYAQSKLAITMWTRYMAEQAESDGPQFIAVNPASLLGSKMVKSAFGVDGGDLRIGADILTRAAVSDEFAHATGQYYDNDRQAFSEPHADALDAQKTHELMQRLNAVSGIAP